MTILSPATALPASTSPSLVLAHPTTAEKLAIWRLNGESWRGALSLDAYLRREETLGNQALTRDGGITFWVLVDTSVPGSAPRKILASCETFKKRALVVWGNNKAEEVVSHGIGSVFCDPLLRGQGYAGRMMRELGEKLNTWQQKDERRAPFTVLFSDIGKKFYAKAGWQAYASSHLALPQIAVDKPWSRPDHLPMARLLHKKDLVELCNTDEALLRSNMEKQSSKLHNVQVAFIPDLETYQWHHAREEFVANELLGRVPQVKGAIVGSKEGSRVWGIWTRTFGDTPGKNTMHILRLVIEGEPGSRSQIRGSQNKLADLEHSSKEHVLAAASVLLAAQHEAANWTMRDVQLWNPTPLSVLAAQEVEPSARITERECESIASLRWHAIEPMLGADVEWVANEKFGWC